MVTAKKKKKNHRKLQGKYDLECKIMPMYKTIILLMDSFITKLEQLN